LVTSARRPRNRARERAMSAAPELVAPEQQQERILILDDEAAILHALRRTFEGAGYRVTACLDPTEALEKLRHGSFQLISADYMMPAMSGSEFLVAAREIQPNAMRILITAAHD